MADKGFQKIELTSQNKDIIAPKPLDRALPRRRIIIHPKYKKLIIGCGIALVLLLFVGALVGLRVGAVYRQALRVKSQASLAYKVVKQQDIIKAREELVKTQSEIKILDSKLSGLSFLKFIPLASGYYNDADHLVNAAFAVSDAGLVTVDALIPYADVLGLKGGGTFVGGTAQDRIRTAVKTMGKVVPQIDKIEAKLTLAKKEIDGVNPNHYPQIGKLKNVRSQIQQIKTITDGAVVAVEQGKPLIKALPTLLGEEKGKKYLVLFQNDAELRPTGGFLTYYAVFRVEEGVIKIDSSSDVYELDNSIALQKIEQLSQ